ncbi:MAG: diacylglycerol kinase family lipid kinase [Anaerolineales bacterium]|nr:diacylglycerol kinase family lipid kinase [Anaerolineales bacterium]
MRVKVILNPYANRWKALKRRPEAEQALQVAGLDYDFEVTAGPGHGIEVARRAARQGFDAIVAAGGDSTYNEIANGLCEAYPNQPVPVAFGLLPMGTANDLADNLGIPKDLGAAAQLIAAGQTRPMDLLRANERYFLNNSAVGMESAVTVIQSEMTKVHGVLRYLLAAMVAIYRNQQWRMHLQWNGGEYHGLVTLVSIGNNPRTGGIFYTVPHADPFDGKLSFVYGSIPTRRGILRTMPKLMKPAEGNYTEHPQVHEVHSDWLKIHTEPATPYHTDGEILARAIQEIHYRVYPHWLPVLLPA